jgi:hypothetical protein
VARVPTRPSAIAAWKSPLAASWANNCKVKRRPTSADIVGQRRHFLRFWRPPGKVQCRSAVSPTSPCGLWEFRRPPGEDECRPCRSTCHVSECSPVTLGSRCRANVRRHQLKHRCLALARMIDKHVGRRRRAEMARIVGALSFSRTTPTWPMSPARPSWERYPPWRVPTSTGESFCVRPWRVSYRRELPQ